MQQVGGGRGEGGYAGQVFTQRAAVLIESLVKAEWNPCKQVEVWCHVLGEAPKRLRA